MDRVFRVVLEQPTNEKGGTLRFRYGTTAATKLSGFDPNSFDIGVNGANAGLRNTLNQEKPGEGIFYPSKKYPPLQAGNPELDHIDNVPEVAIKGIFGDFDLPAENLYNDQRLTKGYEKSRVGMLYGGEKYEAVRVGKNFTYIKTGPPNVPRVACIPMDERGNLDHANTFRPWEHFGWDSDEYQKPEQFNVNVQVAAPVTQVSDQELTSLRKQVEKLEMELLVQQKVEAAMKAPKKKGRPRKIQIAQEMPNA